MFLQMASRASERSLRLNMHEVAEMGRSGVLGQPVGLSCVTLGAPSTNVC